MRKTTAIIIVLLELALLSSCSEVKHPLATLATPSEGGTVVPFNGSYAVNAEIKLTAQPAANFRFDHWSGDATGNTSPVTLNMDQAKNVTAHFVHQFPMETSVEPNGSGVLTPADAMYDDGTEVKLLAQPSTGYRFDRWTGDVTGSTAQVTVKMDNRKKVTARFVHQSALVTSITPAFGGTVTPSDGVYDDGTEVKLLAKPAAGYRFDRWINDGSGDESLTITINHSITVKARFVPVVRQFEVEAAVEPPNTGKVDLYLAMYPKVIATSVLTRTGPIFDPGAYISITAQPARGFCFDRWSGGDAEGVLSNSTIIRIAEDQRVTAHFIPGFQLERTVEPPVGGQYSWSNIGLNERGCYTPGSQADLELDLDYGWRFDHWSGDASGSTENPIILMDGPKKITANLRRYSLEEIDVLIAQLLSSDKDTVVGAHLNLSVLGDLWTPEQFGKILRTMRTGGYTWSVQQGKDGHCTIFASYSTKYYAALTVVFAKSVFITPQIAAEAKTIFDTESRTRRVSDPGWI